MKTIRTILITFGLTTLLYGGFALFCVSIDPPFASRSIFQMFRDTGFPVLVIGIACLLAVLLISFAVSAFRDNPKKGAAYEEDEDRFLEEETVSVEEYEQEWTPKLKRKPRPVSAEEDRPEEMAADGDEPEDDTPALDESLFRQATAPQTQRCVFCGTTYPSSDPVCPKCGRRA